MKLGASVDAEWQDKGIVTFYELGFKHGKLTGRKQYFGAFSYEYDRGFADGVGTDELEMILPYIQNLTDREEDDILRP